MTVLQYCCYKLTHHNNFHCKANNNTYLGSFSSVSSSRSTGEAVDLRRDVYLEDVLVASVVVGRCLRMLTY